MSKNPKIPKPKIAVVESNKSALKIHERSAEKLGIELISFLSAEDSMEYLKDNKPDLLFLSIILPDQDGLTFLRELRNNPIHTETPVVMITSKDYAQDRTLAEELGATEFLVKPVPIQAISDVICKHTDAVQINPN